VIDVARAPVDQAVEHADACTSSGLLPDAPTSAQVSLSAFARVGRTVLGTNPFTAGARTTLTRFELTAQAPAAVVPEPASVTLLGGGLLGLAGLVARRRAGARR
jgi:hypothetical protein